jgi:O-antigen/teichoic acid export membrane protein
MSSPEIEHNNNIEVKPERISRNTFWIFLGQISTVSISFVTIFVLTRYLGPEKFGYYSIAFVLSGILMPLSDLGINLHFNRTVSAEPKLLKEEFRKTFSLRIVLGIIIWVILIITGYILRYSNQQIILIALAGTSMLTMSLGQTIVMALRSLQRMKYESLSTVYGMSAKLIGIVGMIFAKTGIVAIMLAHITGSLIFLITPILFLIKLIGKFKFRIDYSGVKERLKASLPFGLTAIFVALYFRVDAVILSKLKSATEVGIYSGAHNIILASMVLAAPLTISVFPVLAKTIKESRENANKIINQSFLFLAMTGVPLGVALFLISEQLVLLAYGEKFLSTAPVLAILGGAIPLLFLTHLMGNSLGAVGYQKWYSAVVGAGLLLNIILNLILIPKFGERGAALSKLTTEIIGFFVMFYLARKIFEISVLPHIFKICVFTCISTAVFILTFNHIGSFASIILFGIVYGGLLFAFKIVSIRALRNLVKSSV